jgi:hypothetical protein
MSYQIGALIAAAGFAFFMSPFLLEAFIIPREHSGVPRWCGWAIVGVAALMALSGLHL